MAVIYTMNVLVRSSELSRDGTVGHSAILQWFQEVAFQASAALGYDMKKFDEMGAAWLMRSMDVEFLDAAHYQDEIELSTWVSDFRRVRSHREYTARRAGDKALLARARAEWVFLDSKTLALRRVPAQVVALFDANGQAALEPMDRHTLSAGESLGHFESTRRVQQYEIDWMQHVNNTVYVNWIEQQAHDAWRAWGRDQVSLDLRRHIIEYRQAAQNEDALRLVSEAARHDAQIVWQHRIFRGEMLLVDARTLSALPFPLN